jgi:hypothetical protein
MTKTDGNMTQESPDGKILYDVTQSLTAMPLTGSGKRRWCWIL